MVASSLSLSAAGAFFAATLGLGTWHLHWSASPSAQDQQNLQQSDADDDAALFSSLAAVGVADSELIYAVVKSADGPSQAECICAVAASLDLFFLLVLGSWQCLRERSTQRKKALDGKEQKLEGTPAQKQDEPECPESNMLQELPTPARQESGKRSLMSSQDVRMKMAGLKNRCEVIESGQNFVTTDAKASNDCYASPATEAEAGKRAASFMSSQDVRKKMAGLKERCEVIEGGQDLVVTDAKSHSECYARQPEDSAAPKRKTREASEIRQKMAALREQCHDLGESVQSFITTDAKSATTCVHELPSSGFDVDRGISPEKFAAPKCRTLKSPEELQKKMADMKDQCPLLGEGDGRVEVRAGRADEPVI
eukprot:TRINITY_DN59132_c0_g1_i1.p1 TRINITY_DN59132_c0_g1~~TRINITY_DN59132_c0_g1_i1.p1  ORF type:complete len:368 (-),score=89.52 TRINITY_DN59132_c0_g1_i1:289-1392(-)